MEIGCRGEGGGGLVLKGVGQVSDAEERCRIPHAKAIPSPPSPSPIPTQQVRVLRYSHSGVLPLSTKPLIYGAMPVGLAGMSENGSHIDVYPYGVTLR